MKQGVIQEGETRSRGVKQGVRRVKQGVRRVKQGVSMYGEIRSQSGG